MSEQPECVVRLLVEPEAEGLALPQYMTAGAAGADLRAAVMDPVTLAPHEYAMVTTGLKLEIPVGYEAQVRPRSGLAAKFGVTLLNTPGTIDSDYRGVVHVILVNHGREPFTIHRGDRVAQLIIAPVTQATFQIACELSESHRDSGGFGHTGHK